METKVWTYTLSIEKKHLILINEDNKRLLIDTGSPMNLGASFMLCGELQTSSNIGMMNQIRELSGLELDGLIGMSSLRRYHILLDVPSKKIQFSNKPFSLVGSEVKMRSVFGIICFDATVDVDKKISVLFDTGAPVSYLNPEIVPDYVPIDHIEDFHPSLGRYNVDLLPEMVFEVGYHQFPVSFGILPQTPLSGLANMLSDAIVGWDLFHRSIIELDFDSNRMIIDPLV